MRNISCMSDFSFLNSSTQEVIKHFSLLTTLERSVIRSFYVLNALEQEAVNAFHRLTLKLQTVNKEASALLSTVWKFFTGKSGYEVEIKQLSVLLEQLKKQFNAKQHLAVTLFYQLNTSEQEIVRAQYLLLSTVYREESLAFLELTDTQQEAMQVFSELDPLTQSAIQQFLLLKPAQQVDIEAFCMLNGIEQKVIKFFYTFAAANQSATYPFLEGEYFKQDAIEIFYKVRDFAQIKIRGFLSLEQIIQDVIGAFYILAPIEQKLIVDFYSLDPEAMWPLSALDFCEEKAGQCLYTLNFIMQNIIKTFGVLAVTEQEIIKSYLEFAFADQQAIKYYSLLTSIQQSVYIAFYALNIPQQKAIRDFYELNHGLQVLQGPPGTGKTTMIVELLHTLCVQNKGVLVCAPSNKAVQVIAERFFEKYPQYRAALIGVENKLKDSLRPIFIHTWADDQCVIIEECIKRFENYIKYKKPIKLESIFLKIQQVINTIRHAITLFRDTLGKLEKLMQPTSFAIQDLVEIVKTLNGLQDSIIEAAEYNQKLSGSVLEVELLNCAQIVFATLSTTGRRIFKNIKPPEILIIDEASQAVEAETLIAFALQPKKCLLVGDTKQLPATVISQQAVESNYKWSMMWRLIEECNQPSNLLTMQYRMHSSIRQWPSKQYYQNLLEDAPTIATRAASVSQYGSYAFINVASEERVDNCSCYNPQECKQIITLLHELASKSVDIKTQVGIITFYAAQVNYMQQEFNKLSWLRGIKIHTVDSYQGNESDYIIISFVRANRRGGIGFLHDFRRLNVAITRARLALLMVGNAATLERDWQQDVAKLVKDARARNCFFGAIPPPAFAGQSLASSITHSSTLPMQHVPVQSVQQQPAPVVPTYRQGTERPHLTIIRRQAAINTFGQLDPTLKLAP